MPWRWDFGGFAEKGEKIVCIPSTSLKKASEARPAAIYELYPDATIYPTNGNDAKDAKPKLGEIRQHSNVLTMFVRKFPDGVDSTTDTATIRYKHFCKCLESLPEEDTVLIFDIRDLTEDMVTLLKTKYASRRRVLKLDISGAEKGVTLFEIDFKS